MKFVYLYRYEASTPFESEETYGSNCDIKLEINHSNCSVGLVLKLGLTGMIMGIGCDRFSDASRLLAVPSVTGHAISRVWSFQPETPSAPYMTSGPDRIIHCPRRMTGTSDLE